MPIEQVLEELKKYADEFVNVGDAKKAIETNKDEFMHKWAKVNQYYKYIMNNSKDMSDEWFAAIDIVGDIAFDNPSLEKWVDRIIEPSKEKAQVQTGPSIDTATILKDVESLTSEIRNMQSWDPEHIDSINKQLQEYQKILLSNQTSFEPNVFQNLMSDMSDALDKINRFNSMLNSEAMESIMRM